MIVILGIIVGMSAPFISTILDAWLFNATEREVVFSARLALNRMVREIRQVKNVASITTWTDAEFAFVHIDDTVIDFKPSGNLLLRNSNQLTDKLQSPGGLSFTYLDSAGNVTSIKDNLRMVRIKLTLVSGESTITLQSLARFRNV